MAGQKDGHRYTLSVAHSDLPAILIALREASFTREKMGTGVMFRDIRQDLINQRDAQPWVAASQPSRDEG